MNPPNKNSKGLIMFYEFLRKHRNTPILEKVDKILAVIHNGKIDNRELNIDSQTKNLMLKSLNEEYQEHLKLLQSIYK